MCVCLFVLFVCLFFEKGFVLRNIENENSFQWNSNHQSMAYVIGQLSTTDIFDLLINGHKITKYMYQIPMCLFTNQLAVCTICLR